MSNEKDKACAPNTSSDSKKKRSSVSPFKLRKGEPLSCCMSDPVTGTVLNTFTSITHAGRVTGLNRKLIGIVCKNGGGLVEEYHFQYKEMDGNNKKKKSPPTKQENPGKVVTLHGDRKVSLSEHEYNGKPKGCTMCDAITQEPMQAFVSMSEAERSTNLDRQAIGRACNRGGGIVGAYYFRHFENGKDEVYIVNNTNKRRRSSPGEEQPTKRMRTVRRAAAVASTKTTVDADNTKSQTTKKPKSASSSSSSSPPQEDYKGKPRACEMSDAFTNQILEVFPSLSLAERKTGISRSSIARVSRRGGGVINGYRFRYVDFTEIPESQLVNMDSTGRELNRRKSPKEQNVVARNKQGHNVKKSKSAAPPPKRKKKKTKPTKPLPPLPSHLHGVPLVKKQKNECGGCYGARNEQAKHEAVLLCDGQGCNREYHLGCTHLSQVPEGAFYCLDCDAYGTTTQLRQYLEDAAQERADFDTSRAYVESLLEEQHCQEQGNDDSDDKDIAQTNARCRQIPMSELWRITESHRDVMSDPFAKKDKASVAEKPPAPLGPDFLVGKPVRLYCPVGNNYHDGRIIDWRKATHLSSVIDDEPSNAFYGASGIASSEFLVRFPAGANHRKQSLHCWIILEEHAMAVGMSLVWGKLDIKGESRGWHPAQTWLRTSLELLPVCHLLEEDKNQVSYEAEYQPGGETWALTEILGRETHVLLSLESEAVDFFSCNMANQGRALKGQHGKRSQPPSPIKGKDATSNRQAEIATALAYVEDQEQKRVREWCAMPLKNAAHQQAMSIVDEGALPPLVMSPLDENRAEADCDDRVPRSCPQIGQGLDRLWIMELLGDRGVERSLDSASSLSCQLVESTPEVVARFGKMI